MISTAQHISTSSSIPTKVDSVESNNKEVIKSVNGLTFRMTPGLKRSVHEIITSEIISRKLSSATFAQFDGRNNDSYENLSKLKSLNKYDYAFYYWQF